MDVQEMLQAILDSYPYPIVFVDNEFIIRFMNRHAKYHYHQERGYKELLGKNLFDCHGEEASQDIIRRAYEKMKQDGKHVFVKVDVHNRRLYMQGVRNAQGEMIGFIERFELNLELPHAHKH